MLYNHCRVLRMLNFAIQRVHRIGQSRRVIGTLASLAHSPLKLIEISTPVKTLAIRGTSEEVMVARSKALKENKQEFTKEFTDDRTMRDFIEVRVCFEYRWM